MCPIKCLIFWLLLLLDYFSLTLFIVSTFPEVNILKFQGSQQIYIADRYKSLSNPENQLRFVDLQLELLEEFRIRLVQVMDKHDPLGEQSCAIFNAIYYLTEVLQEWNNSAVCIFNTKSYSYIVCYMVRDNNYFVVHFF